ncbi:hypothetical protein [Actinoplanes sp. ATCC 53533]|nr:hypothetical protein [Actinoplanes sp. ATCC 53533]
MKVLFLLNDGFGIGGTITTTFNLGSALAEPAQAGRVRDHHRA